MTQMFSHGETETIGGKYRTTIGIKPVNYLKNGTWSRIQNQLGNTGDPNLSIGVDELAQFRVRGRLSGQAPVVFFGKGNSHVRLTPLDTNNNVNGVVSGQSITYPGAWNNADLRLTIAGHILRKAIVLKTGHPSTFRFRIDDHAGLNQDTLATPDFRIVNPVLEDGVNTIWLAWQKSISGGKTILAVTLPPGDHAGKVLDPTLVLQPDAADGKDSMLYNSNPTTNYGVLTTPSVYWSEGAISRPVIEFNLTSIPVAAVIVSATLLLTQSSPSVFPITVNLHQMTQSWTEAGCTWNTYDGVNNWATAGGDFAATVYASQLFTTDANFSQLVTTLVQEWVNGTPNYGLLAKDSTESGTARYFYLASSDHATAASRPMLTVEYEVPATGMVRAPTAGWLH